jgi:hypothetical protein
VATIVTSEVADLTETFTAGSAVAAGDLVALNASGQVVPANSTTSLGIFAVVGVAVAAAAALSPVEVVVVQGTTTPMRFGSAPGAAANGDYVFLFDTSGEASLTPPAPPGLNQRTIVGVLRGADGVTSTPDVQFQLHSL